MGSSFYIAGSDTDLRETGSIEEVRRYTVATCPRCHYSDYSWNFVAADELLDEERAALCEALRFDPESKEHRPLRRSDFERFRLAEVCFQALGLDSSSLAELALLAYYVGRDLGRRDLEPSLREDAAALFVKALEEEDPPAPLRLRYAYLAGELLRRAGRREDALRHFDEAIQAARQAEEEGAEADPSARDLARLARRMQARALHFDAHARDLRELTLDTNPDVAYEARRIMASRRDRDSVETLREVWGETPAQDRAVLLRELVLDPPRGLFDLFVEGLQSRAPEEIRLAAEALGALGVPEAAEPLLAALRRGVLSTEAALVEALRRVDTPDKLEGVAQVLERWETDSAHSADDEWSFAPDPTPLRFLLYTEGGPAGLELLIRDLRQLTENDLWDKVPSGGPVSAALTLGTREVALALRGLLAAESPATRRWAAYCVGELGETDAASELEALVQDADPVVRLQAASTLARLGHDQHEAVVLDAMRELPAEDVPFALHFLVPFRSAAVKALLLELLDRGDTTTPGEILPLLGRQERDDDVNGLLTAALLDTNDDTRAGGVTGLAYQGGEEVAERLRLLFDQEDSDEVRRRIVFGVGGLARAGHDRERTVSFLRGKLNRGNPRLRFSIALTLLQLGDPTGIDLVRERAALFTESFDRYDLVAPALRTLAQWDAQRNGS
jgi:HEAT repeat protein